jgi:hypothetical protein
MKCGKILMNAALSAGLVVGMVVFAKPPAAHAAVACPPGYYYFPDAGCQFVSASQLNYSQLNYSQLNYSYGYPPPYVYAPYAYPYYYAPYAVIGGIGLRGRR